MHREPLHRKPNQKVQRTFGHDPEWFLDRIVMDDGNEALQISVWVKDHYQTHIVIPGYGSFDLPPHRYAKEPEAAIQALVESTTKAKVA